MGKVKSVIKQYISNNKKIKMKLKGSGKLIKLKKVTTGDQAVHRVTGRYARTHAHTQHAYITTHPNPSSVHTLKHDPNYPHSHSQPHCVITRYLLMNTNSECLMNFSNKYSHILFTKKLINKPVKLNLT